MTKIVVFKGSAQVGYAAATLAKPGTERVCGLLACHELYRLQVLLADLAGRDLIDAW
jgi:hypothetical protein